MNNIFMKLIKNPYVLSLMLAITITCGLVFGTLEWLNHYTRHNEAVIVPDVKGLKIEEAAEFLTNSHLRYQINDSVFARDVEPGVIVELTPAVGSKVKEGRIVFITVNALTSQMATIPAVADLSLRQAYALLKAQGFENIEIEYVLGEYRDLAISVDIGDRVLKEHELIQLSAPLILKVSTDVPPVDSLAIDSLSAMPVQALESDDEKWF